ncbi:aspartyl/asparaginyl beta-hydroxylase domain-containing protein [Flavobacteriaceae bacterium M23B6Z8]
MENFLPITYLKLPFLFDAKRLEEELSFVLLENWIPHFNTTGYEGRWNSIALYAPGGDETHILAMHPETENLQETRVLKKCVYLKEVLSHFKCEFLSVRLLRLEAGAFIKPHRDYNLGYEDGCFRLHIPILTSDAIEFVLHGERLKMAPGECWYTNVNYEHSVANKSQTDRVHLVIDGVRNTWSDELFFSLASKQRLLPETREIYDPETKQLILEQLKLMNTPTSRSLIKKLISE